MGAADTAEFCRSTQISFLRLLTTKGVQAAPLSNAAAIAAYHRLRTDSSVAFCPEPEALEPLFRQFSLCEVPAPLRWMDAYLAAFAVASGLRLVTFDKGFRSFPGLDLLLLS